MTNNTTVLYPTHIVHPDSASSSAHSARPILNSRTKHASAQMATDTVFEVDDLESSPEIQHTNIRTTTLQNTSPTGTNVYNEGIGGRTSPIAITTLHSNTVFEVDVLESTGDEDIDDARKGTHDDDDEFVYWCEFPLVSDDPFEYRNDRGVHVSHHKVMQPFTSPESTVLRPRTRRSSKPLIIPSVRSTCHSAGCTAAQAVLPATAGSVPIALANVPHVPMLAKPPAVDENTMLVQKRRLAHPQKDSTIE